MTKNDFDFQALPPLHAVWHKGWSEIIHIQSFTHSYSQSPCIYHFIVAFDGKSHILAVSLGLGKS